MTIFPLIKAISSGI